MLQLTWLVTFAGVLVLVTEASRIGGRRRGRHVPAAPRAATTRPAPPAAEATIPGALPPPGYHPNPDPSDGYSARWWDGANWQKPV